MNSEPAMRPIGMPFRLACAGFMPRVLQHQLVIRAIRIRLVIGERRAHREPMPFVEPTCCGEVVLSARLELDRAQAACTAFCEDLAEQDRGHPTTTCGCGCSHGLQLPECLVVLLERCTAEKRVAAVARRPEGDARRRQRVDVESVHALRGAGCEHVGQVFTEKCSDIRLVRVVDRDRYGQSCGHPLRLSSEPTGIADRSAGSSLMQRVDKDRARLRPIALCMDRVAASL